MRVRLSAVCSVWVDSHCIDCYIVFFLRRSIVCGSPRQRVALRVFFCRGNRQTRVQRHGQSWRCQRRRRCCHQAAVPPNAGPRRWRPPSLMAASLPLPPAHCGTTRAGGVASVWLIPPSDPVPPPVAAVTTVDADAASPSRLVLRALPWLLAGVR